MNSNLVRAARRGAEEQIAHVSVVRHAAARGLVARVYDQLERDFGILAPPVILHSPVPDLLAAVWTMLRETLVATGKADRAAKEAAAAAVSLGNSCPYCVAAHSTTLHGLVRGRDATAIAAGRLDEVGEPHIRAIAEWGARFGTPEAPERPFPPDQAPELVGTAFVFHYYNRMVNIFLGESPFPPGAPARAHGAMSRVVGRLMAASSRARHAPGGSLDLLPAAPPSGDLSWTGGDGVIADAFARASAVIDRAGERAVPAPVRELLVAELAGWDGRTAEPARIDEAVAGLPAPDRPAGRLVLLTALASHRVGPADVAEFRRDDGTDARLLECLAWAAFTTARAATA
ncbi:carboxymuconolactone decarboxylase family protein [Actinomadura luteofluorescens]|uniref:carboxymuconolactone decarboxylase family protein n=1 Tax=Actinomadura luteofluorescens TaxID=46163 RepID=UPI003486090E